jgi:DNA-directed RNA polymerase subunit RPC12/RpoP
MTCPYCGHLAMPLWRKCTLGPETALACSNCGKKVSVPWVAVIAATPIALGIVAAVRFEAPWSIVGPIAGVIAYISLQRWVVPLVGREESIGGGGA